MFDSTITNNLVTEVGSLRTGHRATARQALHRCLIRHMHQIRSLYRSRFRYLIQHPSRILCLCRRYRWQARPLLFVLKRYLTPHKYRNHPRFSCIRRIQRLFWIVCRHLIQNRRRRNLENYAQELLRIRCRRTGPIPATPF